MSSPVGNEGRTAGSATQRCEFLLGGDGYFRCPALVVGEGRFCDQHKGVEKVGVLGQHTRELGAAPRIDERRVEHWANEQ